jgi:hypothetical protein
LEKVSRTNPDPLVMRRAMKAREVMAKCILREAKFVDSERGMTRFK